MTDRPRPSETPHADAFRKWLAAALVATDLNPYAVARALNVGINTVGRFLREPSRDITLSRAAEIERHLRRKADELGVELPSIRCALPSSGGA